MVAAVGLLVMVAGWAVVGLKKTESRQGARVLAAVVAEELAQARMAAISSQSPVAVCFPSDGGTNPLSDSLYLLAGQGAPQIKKISRFHGDFPSSRICNASWPLASPASAALASPLPGTKWKSFQCATWLPPQSLQDYCFIFLPDGSVTTNELPAFDGAFHLAVVGGGASLGPASPPLGAALAPGPGYYSLTSRGDVYTLRVDQGGPVAVHEGLDMADAAGLNGGGSVLSNPSAPASPGPRVAPAVEVTALAQPRLNPKCAEAGINVTVSPDGYVTLMAQAVDTRATGERLYCAWSVTPMRAATGPGAFCLPLGASGGMAMDWDPPSPSEARAGAWRSTWQWAPPREARAGDKYNLTLAIQDQAGATLTTQIRQLKVIPPGTIYLSSDRDGNMQCFMMNVDGTAQRRFHIFPFTPDNPRWSLECPVFASRDSSRLVVAADPLPYWPESGLRQAYLTDRRGGRRILLSTAGAGSYPAVGGGTASCPDEKTCSCESVTVSPVGDWVAYRRHDPASGNWDLVVRHASGWDPSLPGTPVFEPPVLIAPLGAQQGCHWEAGGPAFQPRFLNDRMAWGDDNDTIYFTKALDASTAPPTLKIFKLVVSSATISQVSGAQSEHDPRYCLGHLYAIAELSNGNTVITRDGAPFVGSGGRRYEMVEPWQDPEDNSWHLLVAVQAGPYPTGWVSPQIYRFPMPATPTGDPPASQMQQLTEPTQGNNLWPVYVR